jgi:adenosine deaminase
MLGKVELHIHLGGSWPIEYLESIATDKDDILNLNNFLDLLDSKTDTDYHQAFQAFGLAAKIVNTIQKVQDGTVALCKKLIEDGVTYVEIRTGLKDYGDGYESYLLAVLNGLKIGTEGSSLVANILLSMKRNTPSSLAQETLRLIKKYNKDGVIGIDLSDDALLGDASSIVEMMDEIRELNIPIALHLGECSEETREQQMRELENFQPQRIGHGVFLCDEAKEWILNRNIPIEMCLSSAVKAHMVHNAADHPALELLKNGYPVCICTDDPLIFRTTLTQECNMVKEILSYDDVQLDDIQVKSFSYRFKKSLMLE